MLTTLLFALTLSATPPADRCAADLARAEAGVVTAQRVAWEAWSPAEERIAGQLVAAAVEQLRTARAACDTPVELVAKASPFETTVDPFEPLDLADADFAIGGQMVAEVVDSLAKAVRP